MDDEDDIDRIEDIDDLQISTIRCLSDHQESLFTQALRIRQPGVVEHILGFIRGDIMSAEVLDVPRIPAELIHN